VTTEAAADSVEERVDATMHRARALLIDASRLRSCTSERGTPTRRRMPILITNLLPMPLRPELDVDYSFTSIPRDITISRTCKLRP
jgi:hypothetical protein